MVFDFDAEVKKMYNKTVTTTSLKAAYNNGKSQSTTSGAGVYALYYNNMLKKIGKAVYRKGIFTRMSQYYRLTSEGLSQISEANRDKIEVKFFFLHRDDCWIAERKLQVVAWDAGERMPWEAKNRN